jgi:hypothetical protein
MYKYLKEIGLGIQYRCVEEIINIKNAVIKKKYIYLLFGSTVS